MFNNPYRPSCTPTPVKKKNLDAENNYYESEEEEAEQVKLEKEE